jgi:hypothetical protein
VSETLQSVDKSTRRQNPEGHCRQPHSRVDLEAHYFMKVPADGGGNDLCITGFISHLNWFALV